MHYGIEIIPFGEFANPRLVMEFARAAEAAGWEGLMVWDHITFPYGVGDPWVLLTSAAAVTEKIKLVSGVAPLPRYRPHLLARLLTSLDILSQGRVILGAGLGSVDEEFTSFGEPGEKKVRAAMLDEGLQVLTQLWSGQPVIFHGKHYTLEVAALALTPIQKPHPPIWIGGESQPALRRAARWDGWIMGTSDENCQVTNTPAQLAISISIIHQYRTSAAPFDIALTGVTQPGQTDKIRPYHAAGATWWFESLFGLRGSFTDMLDRIKAGPARVE
jgi:alkanesulfonate monooxygenase SsuD/methylene tetrahydromethanopterin reductase-like flavin-dependent oxidoreductase (luciferase family)